MKKFFNVLYRHRFDIIYSALLIALISFMFIVAPKVETKTLLRQFENRTFDIRQNIVAKDKSVSKDIVIVSVDDPSYEYLLEEYGDWPIPRKVYADLVDYIQAQNPKYVGFDLLFIKSLNRVPGSDNKLIESFAKYPNTYTSMSFDDYSHNLRKPPLVDEKVKSEIKINSKNFTPVKFTNCRLIMNEIFKATDKIGHINVLKSDDGFLRTIPLIVNYPRYNQSDFSQYKDEYYLYLTLKMAIDYLNKYENQNIKDIVIDKNNNLILGNRKIPLNNRSEAIINWYGESGLVDKDNFKYVSFWEVLMSQKAKLNGEKELLPPDMFKDKIVYIGTNIISLSDIKTVPTSKFMPGVEVHATLFNNILDNNFIIKAPNFVNIIISLIVSLFAAIIVFRIRSVYVSILLFAVLLLSYLYTTIFVMTKYNLWIWVVVPVLLTTFVFVCSFIIKYLIKSRDFEYTYKLATTDGLTELYNHRFFQEKIRDLISKAEKTNGIFSLIMIDIDYFKKFNDKYGHQVGDAVLKNVANTIKSCVRSQDFVCRYGGEEMAILLDNNNKEIAVNIAKKICNTIASKKFELTPELEVNITISLGVSTFKENGTTPAEIVEYADRCLYKAKENGRNQVGFIEE